MDTEWLIVGAGLHGAHLAVRLLERGVQASDLRLIDPKSPFQQWRERTGRLAMSHLRSPSVHHLDIEPMALERFGKKARRRRFGFRGPYARPALKLFDSHCDSVAEKYRLTTLHQVARARQIELSEGSARVLCSDGTRISAKHVVLALGSSETAWPTGCPDHAQHVFDETAPALPENCEVTVVGGGVSAAQLTLSLIERGNWVELRVRHGLKTAAFDSDACWIGPACMEAFSRTDCYDSRRHMIDRARNRGTMPREVKAALSRAKLNGALTVMQSPRIDWSSVAEKEHLWLATGFSCGIPGGELVRETQSRYGLRVAPCGFPIVDGRLRWHPRLSVLGALAELELGPSARNIVGARRAADRILA